LTTRHPDVSGSAPDEGLPPAQALVWRAPTLFTWIGVAGVALVLEGVLETTRVVPHLLTRPMGFPATSCGTWFAYALFFGMGGVLILVRWRYRLTITCHGVAFQGLLRAWSVGWAQIRTVALKDAPKPRKKALLRLQDGSRLVVPLDSLAYCSDVIVALERGTRQFAPEAELINFKTSEERS
jgi:hypothetical protein